MAAEGSENRESMHRAVPALVSGNYWTGLVRLLPHGLPDPRSTAAAAAAGVAAGAVVVDAAVIADGAAAVCVCVWVLVISPTFIFTWR